MPWATREANNTTGSMSDSKLLFILHVHYKSWFLGKICTNSRMNWTKTDPNMLPTVPPRGIYITTPREEHETRMRRCRSVAALLLTAMTNSGPSWQGGLESFWTSCATCKPWRGPSQARGVPMSLWEGAEGTSPFLEIPVSAASPTTEGVKGFKLSGTWNYGKHEGWIVIAVIKTHQHISKVTYSQQKTSRYVHKKIWQIISFSKICVPQACYKMKRYLQGYETCWQFCDVYMTCYIKCYKTNLPYQKAVEPTEGKLKKL